MKEDTEEKPAKGKAKGKGTKRKREDEEEAEVPAAPAKKSKVTIKVDEGVSLPGAEVVDDWGVMLNQTNISANNNSETSLELCSSFTLP